MPPGFGPHRNIISSCRGNRHEQPECLQKPMGLSPSARPRRRCQPVRVSVFVLPASQKALPGAQIKDMSLLPSSAPSPWPFPRFHTHLVECLRKCVWNRGNGTFTMAVSSIPHTFSQALDLTRMPPCLLLLRLRQQDELAVLPRQQHASTNRTQEAKIALPTAVSWPLAGEASFTITEACNNLLK